MEVKINKEIRNYTESMFFGLSLRQFIFSVLACGVAVGLYFLLRPRFGTETLSWVCILGAFPFAAMGFIKYNGILGVSGAGKSFTAKEEMTNIILTDPNADIIIIDPEREYSPLVKAMKGEVIHISATSENHINAIVISGILILFQNSPDFLFNGFKVSHCYLHKGKGGIFQPPKPLTYSFCYGYSAIPPHPQ